MATPFLLLELARAIVDEIHQLLYNSGRPLIHDVQLANSAESITANIREAYGRRAGPERKQFLRYARGSAEETDEHLRSNFTVQRLEEKRYWRLHNRLAVAMKMLTSLIDE